jgi:S1-C subfamily serine protease
MGVVPVSVRGGAGLREVTPGSPAERAGLRAEDVITAVDGTKVGGYGELLRVLRSKSPGDTVSLSVLRDGRTFSTSVRLIEAQQ